MVDNKNVVGFIDFMKINRKVYSLYFIRVVLKKSLLYLFRKIFNKAQKNRVFFFILIFLGYELVNMGEVGYLGEQKQVKLG